MDNLLHNKLNKQVKYIQYVQVKTKVKLKNKIEKKIF